MLHYETYVLYILSIYTLSNRIIQDKLILCLHHLMNLFLLFNNRLCSIKCTFSAQHSRQNFILPFTFSTNDHLISDVFHQSFSDHVYSNYSVTFTLLVLKMFGGVLFPLFEWCFLKRKQILISSFALFLAPALNIRFGARRWFSKGQFSLLLQFQ